MSQKLGETDGSQPRNANDSYISSVDSPPKRVRLQNNNLFAMGRHPPEISNFPSHVTPTRISVENKIRVRKGSRTPIQSRSKIADGPQKGKLSTQAQVRAPTPVQDAPSASQSDVGLSDSLVSGLSKTDSKTHGRSRKFGSLKLGGRKLVFNADTLVSPKSRLQ